MASAAYVWSLLACLHRLSTTCSRNHLHAEASLLLIVRWIYESRDGFGPGSARNVLRQAVQRANVERRAIMVAFGSLLVVALIQSQWGSDCTHIYSKYRSVEVCCL